MLLHDEPGGAGTEGVLSAAQKRGGSGLGDGVGHERVGGTGAGVNRPDAQHPAFASVTAMTALVWSGDLVSAVARVTACAMTVCTVGQRELRVRVAVGKRAKQ